MAIIGYQASHEQFTPSSLVQLAVLAEQAGFGALNSSDHFHPWSERQAQSGYSFAWMGAAMQATSLPCGMVCAPGQRNHPAIVAQAIATLAEMFPDRLWVALGSGEALNEKITGEKWPVKEERNARLKECHDIIKRLLSGELVTHYGRVTVQEAQLYTRPKVQPLIIGAAVSEKTAGWMGGWADGVITVHRPVEELKKVIRTFQDAGGKGKPMYLKVQLSYAPTEEEALQGAFDQWRTNVLSPEILDDLWQVKQFDAAAQFVRPEDLKSMVHISSDLQQHRDWIQQYVDLGFERIILHNVNKGQERFIRDFGDKVLPHLK